MPAALLKPWIDRLQASGRYSFLRSEAVRDSGLTPNALSKALRRAVKDGRILRLKETAYVVVPMEYRAAGAPPPAWFIHDLMTAMKLPYYVGLLSAAALDGASHQQPQVFQVMTDRSVRPISAGRTRIQCLASKFVARAAGHMDHVAALISDMSTRLDAKRLIAAVRAVDDIPNAQRLGYILDQVRQRTISDALPAWVERRIERVRLFRPGVPPSAQRKTGVGGC